MTALIEKLRQRQSAAGQEQQAAIEDARKHYRKLLARADAPQKSDAAELEELCLVLKITPEQIEEDLKTLERARGLVADLKGNDPVALIQAKHASASDFELASAWRVAELEASRKRSRVETRIAMGRNTADALERMRVTDHELLGPEIEPALEQFYRRVSEAAQIEPHPNRRVKITVEVVTDEPTPATDATPAGDPAGT